MHELIRTNCYAKRKTKFFRRMLKNVTLNIRSSIRLAYATRSLSFIYRFAHRFQIHITFQVPKYDYVCYAGGHVRHVTAETLADWSGFPVGVLPAGGAGLELVLSIHMPDSMAKKCAGKLVPFLCKFFRFHFHTLP